MADAVGLSRSATSASRSGRRSLSPTYSICSGSRAAFPRLDEGELGAAAGGSLWELVARWYLVASERLLRQDLLRDYQEAADWLPVVRGRVDAARTARALGDGAYRGTVRIRGLRRGHPLNRTLREAAHIVGASPALLAWSDRRRALAIAARIDEVGPFRAATSGRGPTGEPDTIGTAVGLARHVIAGHGRTIEAGSEVAWTFLIRTPEMVEEGVRAVLTRGWLGGGPWPSKGANWSGSAMTVNPISVFGGGRPSADVKYNCSATDWKRADLYQAVAFAAAFGTRTAALVGFRPGGTEPGRRVRFGEVEVRELAWDTDPCMTPLEAGDRLADDARRWLEGLNRP